MREESKNILNPEYLPKHIGIIMDGNGRWATNRNLPRFMGHKEGSLRVLDIVKKCYELKIPYLTLFAFSTENWTRPESEVKNLFLLLRGFIEKYIDEMNENEIRLNVIGDISPLKEDLRKSIENSLELTKNNKKMVVNIALNYGGQDEIIMATKKIAEEVKKGNLLPEEISKETFESYLYTAHQPPMDLMIRPSGELRVSNFTLYQMAYSEFWFSDVLWPDFTPEVLEKALVDYMSRNRRFGGI